MTGPFGNIWLVPALPLLGVLLNGFLGPRAGKGFVKLWTLDSKRGRRPG